MTERRLRIEDEMNAQWWERIKVSFEDPGVALYWDEQEQRAYWCDPEIADILLVTELSQETLSNALTHLAREIARSDDD